MSVRATVLPLALMLAIASGCARSSARPSTDALGSTTPAVSGYTSAVAASLATRDLDTVTRSWPAADSLPDGMGGCDWIELPATTPPSPREPQTRYTLLVDNDSGRFWVWRSGGEDRTPRISGPATLTDGVIQVGHRDAR